MAIVVLGKTSTPRNLSANTIPRRDHAQSGGVTADRADQPNIQERRDHDRS